MKPIKLTLIVLILTIFTFTSCKDESINTSNNTTESIAAKNALSTLQSHFNPDGSLSRDGENPTNNIIFDFCFDFVYPITLSYNTGTEVTVQDFDGLVNVLISMTDALYINGIAFPFQVEVFNADTNSFEVITIQNEDSFIELLESCSIDDNGQQEDCVCTEEYAPVCVEVSDISGESFTIEFPNMCFAECEGFTQADVVDCDYSNPCNEDYFDDCFDIVFPVTVILPNGDTVQINDEDDLEDIIYTNYYFNFDFPITVEIEVNGQEVTQIIHNEDEFVALLMQCDGVEDDDCEIENLHVVVEDCFSETAYNISLNFETGSSSPQEFMVYFADGNVVGPYSTNDLPITLEVDVNSGNEDSLIVTVGNGNCQEDVHWDIPNCSNSTDTCWEFVYPIEVEINGQVVEINSDAEFDAQYNPATSSLGYPFHVEINGETVQVNTPNDFSEIGGFDNRCE